MRWFAGHPYRVAGAAALGLAGLGIAWYLGSPLFIRTYADEPLPPLAAPVSPAPTFGTAPPGAAEPTPSSPRVLARGQLGFVDDLHNGKGEVRIVEAGAQRFVRFESVSITNAPDIHIYLSTDTGGRYLEANSVYLGPLKATNGSFNYEIPASVDLPRYKSVIVWCRAFTTLITWADVR